MERGPRPLWLRWATERGYAQIARSNWQQESKTWEEGSRTNCVRRIWRQRLDPGGQERNGETACIWGGREAKKQETGLEIEKESLTKADPFLQFWLTEAIEILVQLQPEELGLGLNPAL